MGVLGVHSNLPLLMDQRMILEGLELRECQQIVLGLLMTPLRELFENFLDKVLVEFRCVFTLILQVLQMGSSQFWFNLHWKVNGAYIAHLSNFTA